MTHRPPEPEIDRSLELHMRGDWGMANLHRVCGWVAQELGDRSGPDTRIAIWTGRGYADGVRAVGEGEADIAMVTPAAFATAALDGRGMFAGREYPHLRALGVVPQDDRLLVAVHRDLAVTTFAELRDKAPALLVATGVDDGVNYVGRAAHEVLERSGIDVIGWGGAFLEDERPFQSFDQVLSGRANAIVHEAISLPHWQEFAPDYQFLPIENDVLASLEKDYGWPAGVLPADRVAGVGELRTLDFSDFLMVATDGLADDVAYAIAWILGETREQIETQYRHLPPERAGITYPLHPRAMGRTPIPLHRGAARYYSALPAD